MSDAVHLLLVRAGGAPWALPMASVEETLALSDHPARRLPSGRILNFRGDLLELRDVAEALGRGPGAPAADAVVAWAGGRRRAFAVEGLLGQDRYERHPVPALASGPLASGLVLHDGEPVAILEPGALVGAWRVGVDPFGVPAATLSELAEAVTAAASVRAEGTGAAGARLRTARLLSPGHAADSAGAPATGARVLALALAHRTGRLLVALPDDPPEPAGGEEALRARLEPVAAAVLDAVAERTGVRLDPGRAEVEAGLLGRQLEPVLAARDQPDAPVLLLRGELPGAAGDPAQALSVVLAPSPAKAAVIQDALTTGKPAAARARARAATAKARAKPAPRRRPTG